MRLTSVQISDTDLVCRFKKGDDKALETLIDRHKNKLFGHIYKIVNDYDTANDVFQDTFIKGIHYIKEGKYNEEGKFGSWIMRIAHNLAIDFLRKRKKAAIAQHSQGILDSFSFIAEPSLNWQEKTILDGRNQTLIEMLDRLPLDQKNIIKMRLFRGLSFKEIAEETDISINTALGRMRYAVINLRKIIKQENLDFSLS